MATQPARGTYTTIAQSEDGYVHESNDAEAIIQPSRNVEQIRPPVYIGSVPEPDELLLLPREADSLPFSAFLVAVVELCERFAYYGLSGPFQNYIANDHNDKNGLPGALGLRQSNATALTNLFQFWCYITPLLGAFVSDQYLGKYATIKWFSIIYMAGIVVLFATSLPWSIEKGTALPGLMVAMIVIGIGTGGIKSNVSPLIAEQVRSNKPFVKTLSNGKRVVVDPELTIQRVYMLFYMCINLGSVSAIATTMLELHVGFWSAFLLPLAMFCAGFTVLVGGRKHYIIKPPQGGVIGNAFRALWIAIRNSGDLDRAKPSFTGHRRGPWNLAWDDKFVEELKAALMACKVFLFFPIYWVTYSQMMNNFISQAGQMYRPEGFPNDILPNIDPIAIILLIPLMDRIIYPFIRKRLHLAFTPITRITLGFLVAALAMLYAGTLQSAIYAAPPCFKYPNACKMGQTDTGKSIPNQVHIGWQAPAYVLIAVSEILASVTGLELAYAKAPENMKSFIMSLFLLTSAGGSLLGILIAPLAKDPFLQWLYFGLAVVAMGTGVAFHWTFAGVGGADGGSGVGLKQEDEIELMARGSEDDGYYSGEEERGGRT